MDSTVSQGDNTSTQRAFAAICGRKIAQHVCTLCQCHGQRQVAGRRCMIVVVVAVAGTKNTDQSRIIIGACAGAAVAVADGGGANVFV